jgi:hypothetical protein
LQQYQFDVLPIDLPGVNDFLIAATDVTAQFPHHLIFAFLVSIAITFTP